MPPTWDALTLQEQLEKANDPEKPCHDENEAFETLVAAAAITWRELIRRRELKIIV